MIKSVTPEVADATAAIVVSAIILMSLLPLFKGIMHTYHELRRVKNEEDVLISAENGQDFEQDGIIDIQNS